MEICSKIAERYARALLNIGEKENRVKEFRDTLSFISKIFNRKMVREFLFNPVITVGEKKEILNLLPEGISVVIRNLLEFMIEKRRSACIPTLYDVYSSLIDKSKGVKHAYVRSATPLSSRDRMLLTNLIERKSGGKVKLHTRVDKSILAGFKVRVEDHILDATLNGELSRISKVVLK